MIALLVGVPMWVEPGREVWHSLGVYSPRADTRDPFADRWTFRQLGPSLPPAFLVSAPVLRF